MKTLYTNTSILLKTLLLMALIGFAQSRLFAQNFHVMVSMELTYNHVYAPGKFQWVARMFIYKTGTSSFNDRRLESACFDFSYDTTKLKNPRFYVIRNLRPILSPTAPYSDTQGIYIVDHGNPITTGMPANHVMYDIMATTTHYTLHDSNYMGANFNSCYNCGEIMRVYFDIDSSSSNIPPTYMINNISNEVYRNPYANGFLADTVHNGVSTQTSVGVIPTNPIANPWFKWPYNGVGAGGSSGGLDNDWVILRGTGGTISSWAYSGYVTGILVELPVDVFDFNVFKKNQTTQLVWKTSSSDNIDYFEVERSQNGTTWQSLGQLSQQYFETAQSDYSFIDQTPSVGMNYYRIKHVDYNGQTHFSNIQWVNMNGSKSSDIVLFPNPSNGIIHIQTPNTEEALVLNGIYSQQGQCIKTFDESNQLQTSIDVSELKPGFYFIYFKQADLFIVKQFLKD